MSAPTIEADLDSSQASDSEYMRYRRLWAAVLLQAIRDFRSVQTGARESGFNASRLRGWFESRSTDVRTFGWICLMLDLNPDAMREQINRKFPPVKREGAENEGHAVEESL